MTGSLLRVRVLFWAFLGYQVSSEYSSRSQCCNLYAFYFLFLLSFSMAWRPFIAHHFQMITALHSCFWVMFALWKIQVFAYHFASFFFFFFFTQWSTGTAISSRWEFLFLISSYLAMGLVIWPGSDDPFVFQFFREFYLACFLLNILFFIYQLV